MIDPKRAAALKQALMLASRGGAGSPGPAMAPVPQQMGPIQQPRPPMGNAAARGVPGDQEGVLYEAHPNAQAAQARLQQLQGMGRQGMAQPIGADGMHGVVHWPMQ